MAANPEQTNERYQVADLTIDAGTWQVVRGDDTLSVPRLSFDVLLALIRAAPNTLSVDELMDEVWGNVVVNPETVTKRVELMREALGDDSRDPRYIGLVRGRGYRIIPPVGKPNQRRRSRLTVLVAAVAVAAVAAVALWMSIPPPSPAPPQNSVAVLPFVSMTNDPDDELFADGLTEEISHALASRPGLKVTGRTSSFYYKGRNEDLRDIGETLGVANLLEGSVRRSGDRLRVTAQLVEADDGFHLWSQVYDSSMDDVLDIQRDISLRVDAALRQEIIGDSPPPPVIEVSADPHAYALYLRALGNSYSMVRAADSQAILEQVVEIDPSFAPAWTRLAAVQVRRIMRLDTTYPYTREEGWRRIAEANDRALALDPQNAEAHANLARISWLHEGDAAKAAPLIEKAMQLDPGNLDIIRFAAWFAKLIGRTDEAITLEEHLVDREPVCADCRYMLGKSYLYAGRLEEAEASFRFSRTMGTGGGEWDIGVTLLLQGKPELALEQFENFHSYESLSVQGRAMALYDLGRHEEYDLAMQELIERWGADYPSFVAEALAYTGQIDAAFEWLEKSVAQREIDLQTYYREPVYDKLRDDPRWDRIMRKIGRTQEQLEVIDFAVAHYLTT